MGNSSEELAYFFLAQVFAISPRKGLQNFVDGTELGTET